VPSCASHDPPRKKQLSPWMSPKLMPLTHSALSASSLAANSETIRATIAPPTAHITDPSVAGV